MIDWLTQVILQLDIIFFITLFFSEKSTPSRILLWGLIFLLIPIVGFIVYLFIGQTFYSEQQFDLKGVRDATKKDVLDTVEQAVEEEPDPEVRMFYREISKTGGLGYSSDNDVRLYTLGEDKFRDLYADLRNAKEYIHLEYYSSRNDELGNELVKILTDKVKEGLEVKLLTDAFGVGKGPKKALAEYIRAGGSFAAFHRVAYLLLSPKKNNRNHRKIAVIDGKVAYCGGFNVGDEYLGKGPLGFWRDTAVRLEGGAVPSLQYRFQVDWEYATKKIMCPEEKLQYYYLDPEGTPGDARAMIVSGGPDVADFNPVRMQYLSMINQATKSVYLHSPYFIPDDSLQDALSLAAARGVDVRVIIPDKPDHMFVFWNNLRCANAVMGNGVRVYLYNRGFVHSKTMVVDGKYCSVGSANFDDRSLVLNFETNAVVFSEDLGKQMDAAFLDDLNYCTEYTQEDYESLTGYQVLRSAVSKMFSGLA